MNWDKFGMCQTISFCRYPERLAGIIREGERVCLNPLLNIRCPMPTDASVPQLAACNRMVASNLGMINSLMNHYSAVKTAHDLGFAHVLITEDDIRFLNDLRLLQGVIETLPADYDLALLDWWHRAKATDEDYAVLESAPFVALYWKRFTNLRSAACYAMSRRAMEKFIALVEGAFGRRAGFKLRITDQFWPVFAADPTMNCYCAFPCAAVQVECGGSMSNMDSIWRRYNRAGMRRESYAD